MFVGWLVGWLVGLIFFSSAVYNTRLHHIQYARLVVIGALVVTAGLLAAALHVFGQNKATSPSHAPHPSFFPQLFFRSAHDPLQTLSAITLSSCFALVGAPPHVFGQNKATSPSHAPHPSFFPQLFFRCTHFPLQTLSAITLSSAAKPVRFAR